MAQPTPCPLDWLENSYFWVLKNPKGGPFYVKNFFVSDFAQILYLKWLGHKNFKFQVSSNSGIKFFSDPKGGPF